MSDVPVKPVSLILPFTPDKMEKRGWVATVTRAFRDDKGDTAFRTETLVNFTEIELYNPRFGVLRYGLTQAGYDGWAFHELGGGGSVILPCAMIQQRLFVGLLQEQRHNMGGKVWNCPRGFLNSATENHFEAAKRELAEELMTTRKLDVSKAKVFPLDGEPGNCNSAFWETPAKDEGVRYFGAEFNAAALEQDGEGGYVFKEGLLRPDPALDAAQKAMGEKILKSRFVHWTKAAMLADMFTNAAVARLLAKIRNGASLTGLNI